MLNLENIRALKLALLASYAKFMLGGWLACDDVPAYVIACANALWVK